MLNFSFALKECLEFCSAFLKETKLMRKTGLEEYPAPLVQAGLEGE